MSSPCTQGLLAAIHLQTQGIKCHAGVTFNLMLNVSSTPVPISYPSESPVDFFLNMFKMCLFCHHPSLSHCHHSPTPVHQSPNGPSCVFSLLPPVQSPHRSQTCHPSCLGHWTMLRRFKKIPTPSANSKLMNSVLVVVTFYIHSSL